MKRFIQPDNQCVRCGDVMPRDDMGEGGICQRCWDDIDFPDNNFRPINEKENSDGSPNQR